MSDPIIAVFFRVVPSLDAIKSTPIDCEDRTVEINIIETKKMTTAEYDAFTADFLADQPWLNGKGGSKIKPVGDSAEEVYLCIAVTARARKTLYINPHGHSYARYVGIALFDT